MDLGSVLSPTRPENGKLKDGFASRWASIGLTVLLWVSGFRRGIVARNIRYTGLSFRPGFHRRLCRNAARDVCALFRGGPAPMAPTSGTRSCLETMREQASILLTAHFHNWEFMGSELNRQGLPLLSAALPLRGQKAEQVLQRLRRKLGVATVARDVPRAALRHLAAGGCFALLWDQHAPRSEYEGRFFGRAVRLNPLLFFLRSHHPCPVYFGAPLPGGGLRLLPLIRGREKDWEKKLTRRYHRVLEILIRRHPEYWYGFFHARFKNLAPYPGHRSASPALFSNLWGRKNVSLSRRRFGSKLNSAPRMHPFFPVLSLMLLGMADAAGYFLFKNGSQPAVAIHRNSVLVVIGASIFFGGGVAFWLRRFKIRFPGYVALASVAVWLGLWLVRTFSGR